MEQHQAIPLSVVMPAYNEEDAIETAVQDVQEHIFTLLPDAELVVVNDGSRDRTGEILDRLAEGDPRVRVVHQANGGHGPALMAGMENARGEYLFLVDSDRQIPLDAFAAVWEAARARDGAFGVRSNRHDPAIRLALTKLVRLSLWLLFGVRIYDANVPFKIFRRSIWEQARKLIPADTLAPSIFIGLFMRKRKLDVAEVPVPHRERSTGVISIRRWKLFRFCLRALGQLLAFRGRLA